ncbi:MAG: pyridoxamine 5'-phosphate oxidase family protein [Eubacteriaceae bacterium]|nr:pyridoxamine 5'-phosphate oxidase family protein [Eubacteriaceae bacterium]
MRRKDREITDRTEIISIMKKCDVCRLALFDDKYPYIVPLNFGLDYDDKNIFIYFHCADKGKKLDLINANNNVGFEMDTSHKLVISDSPCGCTMEYESIIGNGKIEILSEEKKEEALDFIMAQYTEKSNIAYSEQYLKAVTILKLTVKNITCKRLKK